MSLPPPQPDRDPWIGFEPSVSRRYVTVVVASVMTLVLDYFLSDILLSLMPSKRLSG